MKMRSEQIERQYEDETHLYEYLMQHGEVSYASYLDAAYRKVLALSAASFFESKVSEIIIQYARIVSGKDKRITELVRRKVIERQYHTLFEWKTKSTNSFWALFGDDTKLKVKTELSQNAELKEAEENFLYVGNLRNLIVHENFAEYEICNITAKKIYEKYQSACEFVTYIETVLNPSFLK